MPTKHLYVLNNKRTKGDVGTMKHVSVLQRCFCCQLQGGASFVDPFCFLCFMFVFVMLLCLFLTALCDHLLGKG